MFDHLQTHRQLLFDLSANYLEPLKGGFQRLAYLSGLREPSSGRYLHDSLAPIYGSERVDEVIAGCHEEVFERLLEMPLNSQREDLRLYLNLLPGSFEENVKSCQENAKRWMPPYSPSYLKELFCSNVSALLELLRDNQSTARSGT
jgi:hypothetical protein